MSKKLVVREQSGIDTSLTAQVFLIRDGKQFAAYCPALELAAYGATKTAARRSFDAVVENFVSDTVERGTLEQVLLKLGWSIVQLNHMTFYPPISRNEDLLEVLKSGPEDVYTARVAIPDAA